MRENTRRAFSLDGIWNSTHRSDTEESNEVKAILYQESGKKQNCQQPFYHKSKQNKTKKTKQNKTGLELGIDKYTLLYLKQKSTRTYCIA